MTKRTRRTARGLHAALTALLALAAAGCGRGEAAPQGQGGGRGGPGGGPGGARAVVETSAVERGSIHQDVSVSGAVEPLRLVGVNSQLSGALLAVTVEEGSPVSAGQVLARVDDRELAAQQASAEAAFAVAQSAYERAEELRKRQVITVEEYERDRTAHAAAKAQLDQIRTRRGYAVVRAPSSGVVLEKRVEAGDVVAPQTRLFTIGENAMVVRVSLSELDVVKLAPGQEVGVTLDAYPRRPFTGRIRRIFPAADPTTRLVPVEVALTGEAERAARPGFLARVTASVGTQDNVLLVPASAIVASAGQSAVFVVRDGKAARREVETGLNSQGKVQIVSGLQAGEVVVTLGNNNVRDGAEVRVVKGPGAGAAPRQGGAAEGRPQPGGGAS
jgi:RND family efflux transporter MFP subunit